MKRIFNDTHREKLRFNSNQHKNLLKQKPRFFRLFSYFNTIIKFYTFHCHILKDYRCLNQLIHQTDRKGTNAPLSKFEAKLELVSVLTQENALSLALKLTEGAQVLLENANTHFQNRPPFERSACSYVTINGNFERFQYFFFEIKFLKNENLFK